MALLWYKHHKDKIYEVRQAGASTRLYTNGIFHSQYNHRSPITGNLWNMLTLPVYLHAHPDQMKRVLVLGVGGGAVMRHILQAVPQVEVIGVDLDKTHLMLARRFFGVKGKRVKLVHAEAVEWISRYEGPGFDLIIDDLFGEAVDAQQLPRRAVSVTSAWLRTLQSRLLPGGVLSFNLETLGQQRTLLRCLQDSRPHPFAQVSTIRSSRYENAVVALHSSKWTLRAVENALSTEPAYRRWLKNRRLPYQLSFHGCD